MEEGLGCTFANPLVADHSSGGGAECRQTWQTWGCAEHRPCGLSLWNPLSSAGDLPISKVHARVTPGPAPSLEGHFPLPKRAGAKGNVMIISNVPIGVPPSYAPGAVVAPSAPCRPC